MYVAHTQPSEFDAMDFHESRRLAVRISAMRHADQELMLQMARFVAMGRVRQQQEEIRG